MAVRRMLQAEGVTEGTMRTAGRPVIVNSPRGHGGDRSSAVATSVLPAPRQGIPLAVLIKSLTENDGSVNASITTAGASESRDDVQIHGQDEWAEFCNDPTTKALAKVANQRGWSTVPLFPLERPGVFKTKDQES